jgi:ACR3 family arsenite transporter
MNKRLSFLDRYLTLWIFLAMAAGLAAGKFLPFLPELIGKFTYGTTNIALALGLILMMIPPLAKVDYSLVPGLLNDSKRILPLFAIIWILGPFLLFFLGLIFVGHQPEYLSGLILIGIAPCIAMVIVWIDLAGGNRELAAGLVGVNSILQVLLYSFYAWFFHAVMLPLFGADKLLVEISVLEIAKTVGIYLGLPFLFGILIQKGLSSWKGSDWYKHHFLPRFSPLTLFALLFTIFVMFSLKGEMILDIPFDVLKIALPLSLYFIIMFFFTYWLMKRRGADYKSNVAASFTAAGNNFELAIAVAIGIFGVQSGQAFAGVVGPLVEVPVLLALVKVVLRLKENYSS